MVYNSSQCWRPIFIIKIWWNPPAVTLKYAIQFYHSFYTQKFTAGYRLSVNKISLIWGSFFGNVSESPLNKILKLKDAKIVVAKPSLFFCDRSFVLYVGVAVSLLLLFNDTLLYFFPKLAILKLLYFKP